MTGRPWLRIGWRNLGRNRRRTTITALGLALGYFAVVLMVGWAEGMQAEMIENGTGILTGQLQIHDAAYRPERKIYDTIGGRDGVDVEGLLDEVARDPAVTGAAPRVFAGGLVSSGEATCAGILLGIDPAREARVSRLLRGVVGGRAPTEGSNEVLLGTEMARQLEAEIGDEVILVVPAADGSMGNDLYRVSGVFRSGLAEIDASWALLPIDSLQELVALSPRRIHEIAVATSGPWLATDAAARLAEKLEPRAPDLEVEPWTRLRPEILDYARLSESWYGIVIAIVFSIAVFGVANTMLMATYERRREFAVLLALGTSPSRILLTVLGEALFLGLLSLGLGAVVTLPILAWWHRAPPDLGWLYGEFTMFGALIRPVLRVEPDGEMAVWAGVALLGTALVAAVVPALRASRVPPADTLSGT
jgi:ABC-type lipoprotein release transport system permease subunit